ncbi:MAG: HNH endonuclease, partial [Alphaproteobacteria bacterium]|nr:HNH endonuclease [Alphaproteobacteria bacterium]
TLQLDHIDGDPYNHQLENLRFLCPNCHSQTETFSGRNRTST